MLRRISGTRRLLWIATKIPSNTTAPARTEIVTAEPQPSSGARTIANTAAARPAVTVTAPAMSIAPRWPCAPGMRAGVAPRATRAIGTLTKKTHSQLSTSVSTPPRNTPAVPPAGAAAP
jgi:hypothetical protein